MSFSRNKAVIIIILCASVPFMGFISKQTITFANKQLGKPIPLVHAKCAKSHIHLNMLQPFPFVGHKWQNTIPLLTEPMYISESLSAPSTQMKG